MAGASCDSPLRRFAAKDLPSKSNSPVEVNRLKSLLRKKVGEDAAGNAASPKKASSATPRKEVKVKRGATVKLCTSCETHNKDVEVDQKKSNAAANAKRVVAKKNANPQGQSSAPADVASAAVEKKAAAKKPRVTKKKAVTQEEKLDGPSTSGTVQSVAEGSVLTGSGTQAEGDSKPKRQRKKVEKAVQPEEPASSVGKAKSKSKEVIKVKVAAPKKKTKNVPEDNEKVPFDNMDVTDLVNSVHQGEDFEMQNASETKPTKTNKERHVKFANDVTPDSTLADAYEPSDNLEGSSVAKDTASKSKPKTKDATKQQVSKAKKTAKNVPEDNEKAPFEKMDITDLVDSIQQGEDIEMQNTAKKSNGSTKSKPTKMSKGQTADFAKDVTPDTTSAIAGEGLGEPTGLSVGKATSSKSGAKTKDATKSKVPRATKKATNVPEDNEKVPFEKMDVTDLVNSIQQVDEPSDNLEESSTAKKAASKSKPKINSTKTKIPRLKKTTKNLPEDNQAPPFENMDVTDLVNSIQQGEDAADKSSTRTKDKPKKAVKPASTNKDKTLDNSKNDSHNKEVSNNSEDMFKDDSITNIQKRMAAMNFSNSNKTAPKDKTNSENSSNNVYSQGDISHDPIDTILTPATQAQSPFDGTISDFLVDTNDDGIAGISTGKKINLSTSTNLSHDDATEDHSMDLNDKSSDHHANIDNDETFFNANLSNTSVDDMESTAYVTLRTRINLKNKANSSKNVSQENTSRIDGSSFLTPSLKDSNDDTTQKISNQNDENQQPSAAGIEHSTQVKSEPVDDAHGNSSQSFSNHDSTGPSGSKEKSVSAGKSKKQAPKSKAAKNVKLQEKTSKVAEPAEKKSQKSADKSVNSSLQKDSESSKKESESSKKKSKPKKNDETLCKKHKNSKKCEEKSAHRLAKEKKTSKQLKSDMKVAKAMATMSEHFSRISIGTTIGTINEVHIGKLSSDSESSSECSTDCSCDDYSTDSASSGGHCKCWKCLMEQSDPSDSSGTESSSSDDDESGEEESSSSESTGSASSSSSSSPEQVRRPVRKCNAKETKSAKPTYKEKLKKYCSKYDLRCNSSRYDLRSKD